MPLVVVYDANVLYPSSMRDVLIRVGLARLVQPKWTEQILDEVFRNLRANRPDLDPARLDRTRELMNASLRDVTVTGYEHRVVELALPDPDDRHVLAAAIHADAQLIVTKNLRDFPAEALAPWGVEAKHPDAFLTELHYDTPDALGEVVQAIASAWGSPGPTPRQVIDRLAEDAPDTADLIVGALRDRPSRQEPSPTVSVKTAAACEGSDAHQAYSRVISAVPSARRFRRRCADLPAEHGSAARD